MKFELLYGKETLRLVLPEDVDVEVIEKPTMIPLKDAAAAVRDALNPVSATGVNRSIQEGEELGTLSEAAAAADSCCILICDITRPVPNGIILPALIDCITEAGMSGREITVLVATGLHRPNLGEELEELICMGCGSEAQRVRAKRVLEIVTVANHDARDDDYHVDLGMTDTGTPVKIDKRFVEAGLKIVVGLVEPHFMAGYSGGRKLITPGIAHYETIATVHSSRFMSNTGCRECNMGPDNPLHAEQIRIVEMIKKKGPIYGVNAVLDDQRRLCHLTYGDIIASHGAAVEYVKAYAEVSVRSRFTTVVTSSAGYPLDKTYYQTIKGMVTCLDLCEAGGDLIIASEISEGLGSEEFRAAQISLCEKGPARFKEELGAQANIDEWQSEMLCKALGKVNVYLYSPGLCEADRSVTAVTVVTGSIEECIADSLARHGGKTLAIIPEGPYVVPLCAGAGGG